MVAALVASAAGALVFARRAQRLSARAPTGAVSFEHDHCFFSAARTRLCCAQVGELVHICRPTISNILHKAQQLSPTRSNTRAKLYYNQHKPGSNLSGWPTAGIESNPCCTDDCCVQASRRLHAVARAKPGRLAPHASSCYHLTHLPLHTSTLCPLS